MGADYQAIVRNLLAFHDFQGLTVISVGAGGGRLLEYGRSAGRVIAVDSDPAAVRALEARLEETGLRDKFAVRTVDFLEFEERADLVLFEFSLHEMPDPDSALAHARGLAPEVVVMDHWTESPWVHYVAEEEKVRRGWDAVGRAKPASLIVHRTLQVYGDFDELELKFEGYGSVPLSRIEEFRGKVDIVIPMSYALALIRTAGWRGI
jgi:hypothetical protein